MGICARREKHYISISRSLTAKLGSRPMKKILASVLVASAFGIATSDAANTSGQFNVNVTLNSTCSLSAVTAIDFPYTSFQGGVANGTAGGYTVTCTNSLPYSFGLQTGTGAATPPGAATI